MSHWFSISWRRRASDSGTPDFLDRAFALWPPLEPEGAGWEDVSPVGCTGGDIAGSAWVICTGSEVAGHFGGTEGGLPELGADSPCSWLITDSMLGVISGAAGWEWEAVESESPSFND